MASDDQIQRAAVYAALGDPHRLAIVDDLAASDRTSRELSDRHAIPGNLLAHHLHVLEEAGVISRNVSAGDRRRRYVRLTADPSIASIIGPVRTDQPVLFLCSHNSARSQLAAVMWRSRTGGVATSAGTQPSAEVHHRAITAARRAGLCLDGAVPTKIDQLPTNTQVITVCDNAHEELTPGHEWWHWSIPDPVLADTDDAFDAVVTELRHRISQLHPALQGGDE